MSLSILSDNKDTAIKKVSDVNIEPLLSTQGNLPDLILDPMLRQGIEVSTAEDWQLMVLVHLRFYLFD